MCGRFKEYDGPMLDQFIRMQKQVPEAFHSVLLKEDIPMTDIVKINLAINHLCK